MTSLPEPKRGEIWWVCFDPSVGSELTKTRPAVVVSSDAVGILPIKLVVPLTEWKDRFAENIWHVRIEPSALNQLDKVSAADVLQLKSVALERFTGEKGRLSADELEEIVLAIAAVVEHV